MFELLKSLPLLLLLLHSGGASRLTEDVLNKLNQVRGQATGWLAGRLAGAFSVDGFDNRHRRKHRLPSNEAKLWKD